MAELCAQIILRSQHRVPRHLVPSDDATETRVRGQGWEFECQAPLAARFSRQDTARGCRR